MSNILSKPVKVLVPTGKKTTVLARQSSESGHAPDQSVLPSLPPSVPMPPPLEAITAPQSVSEGAVVHEPTSVPEIPPTPVPEAPRGIPELQALPRSVPPLIRVNRGGSPVVDMAVPPLTPIPAASSAANNALNGYGLEQVLRRLLDSSSVPELERVEPISSVQPEVAAGIEDRAEREVESEREAEAVSPSTPSVPVLQPIPRTTSAPVAPTTVEVPALEIKPRDQYCYVLVGINEEDGASSIHSIYTTEELRKIQGESVLDKLRRLCTAEYSSMNEARFGHMAALRMEGRLTTSNQPTINNAVVKCVMSVIDNGTTTYDPEVSEAPEPYTIYTFKVIRIKLNSSESSVNLVNAM